MGFGPFSSESNATDNRIAATEQAVVVRGSGKNLSSNALDFSKANVNTGILLSKLKLAKGASITIGDGGAGANAVADVTKRLSDLSGQFANTSTQFAQSSTATTASFGAAINKITADALGKVNDLSQGAQSLTSNTKTLLWVVALTIAGFFIYKQLR